MKYKISYSKNVLFVATASAVSVAALALTSCGGENGKSCGEASAAPAGIYREYLSDIRRQDTLSFEELTARLRRWQTIRDSISAHIRRDTTQRPHGEVHRECLLLHDSVRAEFSRLVLSKPRTYKELLLLKERLSPFGDDAELLRSAAQLRPFFDSLDSRPACRGDKGQILSTYRTLLSETLRRGIHGRDDLTAFIAGEDAVYRSFLARLSDFDGTNTADIVRATEKCCAEVFLAAERQEITYKEALLCMALRTDRRVIQNVRACLDDIRRGKVTTPRRTHAYIWMVLQPYASLDGLCLALLSPRDREALDRIAAETPAALAALRGNLPSEDDRLDELPALLMDAFIASL